MQEQNVNLVEVNIIYGNTFSSDFWKIGKQISRQKYDKFLQPDGKIYVFLTEEQGRRKTIYLTKEMWGIMLKLQEDCRSSINAYRSHEEFIQKVIKL